MPGWEINIDGEELDVQAIGREAPPFGCFVRNDGDGRTWLGGAHFDTCTDEREMAAEAVRIVRALNGIVRMSHHDHRPVKVGGSVVRTTNDGKKAYSVLAGTGQYRIRGRPVGGGDDVGRRRAEQIAKDASLQEVAEALGGDLSWQRLRVAYEKIRKIAGNSRDGSSDNGLISKGYTNQKQATRFRKHVEDHRLTGIDAVHGVSRGKFPDVEPMTIQQGLEYVVGVFNAYLDHDKNGKQ